MHGSYCFFIFHLFFFIYLYSFCIHFCLLLIYQRFAITYILYLPTLRQVASNASLMSLATHDSVEPSYMLHNADAAFVNFYANAVGRAHMNAMVLLPY